MLGNLHPKIGSKKDRKRIGRGKTNRGKTSGRGHKGQRSRSGGRVSSWFEGGQTPLKLRSRKRGFNKPNRIIYEVVDIKYLNVFEDSDQITTKELTKAGLVSGRSPVKILGGGKLEKALIVKANWFSRPAIKKIEEKGGKAEIV